MNPYFLNKETIDAVAQDVRGMLDGNTRDWLYEDAQTDIHYDALVSLKMSVESQLSNWKSRAYKEQARLRAEHDDGTRWLEWMASQADWLARAKSFRSSVEEHIIAVKQRKRYRSTAPSATVADLVLGPVEEEVLDNGARTRSAT